MKMHRPRVRHADILLRCFKKEHENCTVMRNALMKNFKNVTSAYTTRTMMDGTDYCVSASAIVKEGELNSFKKRLQRFKGRSPNQFKVSNVKLQVIKH